MYPHNVRFLTVCLSWHMLYWTLEIDFITREENSKFVIFFLHALVGRDSSVSIAIRYGLDGPGFEPRWGRYFRTRPDPASSTTGTGSLSRVENYPGRGVDHPLPSSAEFNERVELYFYPPLWVFVAYSRVNFALHILSITTFHDISSRRIFSIFSLLYRAYCFNSHSFHQHMHLWVTQYQC